MKFPKSSYEEFVPTSQLVETPVIVEENGTRIRVVRKVESDPEPYKDYTSSDFELQTLIETGNINNVQSVHTMPGSLMDAIDTVTDTYNQIVSK